jgi:transposase InsO family protein
VPFPDLVCRDFSAPAPNVRWCGDVKQIDTLEGPLYLASVEDLFSRRMLGFATSDTLTRSCVATRCTWPRRSAAVTSPG